VKIDVERVPFELVRGRGNLLQSGFWASFKAETDLDAFAFDVNAAGTELQLVLTLRPLADGSVYAYAPHAPDLEIGESSQGKLLESLSEELADHLPESCAFVRYDTLWETPYRDPEYFDLSGSWKGPPEPRVRELRMNFGCSNWNLRKAVTDHQAPDTVVVDLTAPEETILSRMRPTTRNCIRRSVKKGLSVRCARPEELREWHRLYRETALRKGFAWREYRYFEDLFTHAACAPDAPDLRLVLAEAGGELAAGAIIALYGPRAYYLYAGSSTAFREFMPNYGLQWYVIRLAKAAGCAVYDLFGIPPNNDPTHPLHGLYTFKTGFGGRIVHRRGCWDYPYDPASYGSLQAAEYGMYRMA
jgi:lipid II:glycine glycyltransferase (peptidoglycan interpeptide bridge formation enzyme)